MLESMIAIIAAQPLSIFAQDNCQDQGQGVNKGWPKLPKENPNYKNKSGLLPIFGETIYEWHEQLSSYHEALKSMYKVEKASYDAFCADKMAQIPAIKYCTTRREAIKHIKKKKLKEFRERFAQGVRLQKKSNSPNLPPTPSRSSNRGWTSSTSPPPHSKKTPTTLHNPS
jgi:hypothetical protein